MVTDELRDFFVAAAGVAGALVGLLFVAISVSTERLRAHEDGPLHRIRASASLTAFTNALVVSLFALIPGALGSGSLAFAIAGLTFVAGALLTLRRFPHLRWRLVRDLAFLIGLAAVFVTQLLDAIAIETGGSDARQDNLALLVVFCFLIGIARAWELIGGPAIGLRKEAVDLGRDVVTRRRSEPAHDTST